jgi:DNA-binding MarR family transcriptional regulator
MGREETGSGEHFDALALAENLRVTLGKFVRGVKAQASTPTTSQSETLSLLDRAGPLSVAELAERRNVKHQSMRLVAGQLESDGFISKSPNPADGRSQLLSITQDGREELSRSREARTSQIAKVIEEHLSDEERRTLAAAILVINREIGMLDRATDECALKRAIKHCIDQHRRRTSAQRQLHRRKVTVKTGEHRRQPDSGGCLHGA